MSNVRDKEEEKEKDQEEHVVGGRGVEVKGDKRELEGVLLGAQVSSRLGKSCLVHAQMLAEAVITFCQ